MKRWKNFIRLNKNMIFSKADAILWIYLKYLLNPAYYQTPLPKHSMTDSSGGFQNPREHTLTKL